MSIEKSTLGGLMIVDSDGDRVIIESVRDNEADKIIIKGDNVVEADRSDIEKLTRYLTKWLEETPIPDGWYVMKWQEDDRGVFATRVYGGVHFGIYGQRIEPLDPNETTYIRRLGDLTEEDISTLNKEDM